MTRLCNSQLNTLTVEVTNIVSSQEAIFFNRLNKHCFPLLERKIFSTCKSITTLYIWILHCSQYLQCAISINSHWLMPVPEIQNTLFIKKKKLLFDLEIFLTTLNFNSNGIWKKEAWSLQGQAQGKKRLVFFK